MKKIWCCIVLLLLSGCLFPSNKESNFYYLKPLTADKVETIQLSKPIRIGIQRVEIPPYLDRPQMVSVQGIQLNVSEWNRWGENLSTLLQRTIAEDVALFLPKAFVKPQLSSQEDFKYTILVEINKLNEYVNSDKNVVILDAYWTVYNTDGTAISHKRTQLERVILDDDDKNAVIVDTISSLIGDLSKGIALEIKKISQKQ